VKDVMPRDGGNAEEVLAEFSRAGVNIGELANELQREGAEAFDKSWNDLMECIASKTELLKKAG
jgi:transaldolase